MAKPIIGAQLYTCHDYTQTATDLAETLKKVADIGYTTVQISGIGADIDPSDVAKMLADNQLTCNATHMGWGEFLNDLDAVIARNKMWGNPHPAIGGLDHRVYPDLDGIKRFGDELAGVVEKLTAAGMDFSYHNHHVEFFKLPDGRTWLAALYEEVPAGILKAEIDTYWVQAGGGSPAAWLTRCAGRIPIVHFKDMVFRDDEAVFAEVGEGNLDWPAIIQACDEGGCEVAFIEQDNCYDRSPFESLAISYRNLTAMGLR
ncbi:MAG: sugar phosphate isomerase/epimerase family protein [Planctomycetota bacterium]|jgi:sugar phosphate isomerase/epimerase